MSDYVNVTELFGCDVFNDAVMEERLPKKVYKEPQKTKVYYKGYSVFNSEQTRASECDEPAAIPEIKQISMKKTSKDYQQKTLNLWQEKYQTIA